MTRTLVLVGTRKGAFVYSSDENRERWEISEPLLDHLPPVRNYPQGSWGPNQIHQLIAPFAWRLPFERKWRDKTSDPGPRSPIEGGARP